MIKELEILRPDEIEVILEAPILVSILIAGADGNIDQKERKEAIKIAGQYSNKDVLKSYYDIVNENFENKLNEKINSFPKDIKERNKLITSELRKLNFILLKIDKKFAMQYIFSLKEIAKKVAKSSGGLLGYFSISYEEAKLLELSMIHDIN